MPFTYEEVLSASNEYFQTEDGFAPNIFASKYSLKDNIGIHQEKTPDALHWRLANEFARVEQGKFKNPMSAKEFHSYMYKFGRIILQGSPMYGIGNPYQTV